MYDESKIPSIVSSILNGSMSPDDAIKAMVLKERWCSKEELLSTWIQLIKTKKIVSNRAFEIGTMLNLVDVWITLLESRVLSTEKIWEAATCASRCTHEYEKTFKIWYLVATSIELPLLSIEQMFELAKRLRNNDFLITVLKSGRLTPSDVLITGYNTLVVKDQDGDEDFRSYLSSLEQCFDNEFWEKDECLSALRNNPTLGVASIILKKLVLREDELDEINAMNWRENSKPWKVAKHITIPMIRQKSLSYPKALLALRKYPDSIDVRGEILKRFGNDSRAMCESDFLSVLLDLMNTSRPNQWEIAELYRIAQKSWLERNVQ
ncbi:MAG: hypothetical protein KBD54_02775 [Candidatus Pacebacteria bacterium]|nr:hypothetical protein [Candidatus Paceibacterota bacterium]